jgi:hypothetical protein
MIQTAAATVDGTKRVAHASVLGATPALDQPTTEAEAAGWRLPRRQSGSAASAGVTRDQSTSTPAVGCRLATSPRDH